MIMSSGLCIHWTKESSRLNGTKKAPLPFFRSASVITFQALLDANLSNPRRSGSKPGPGMEINAITVQMDVERGSC